MRNLIAIRTSKTSYKFINIKQLKEDIANTMFWVLMIGSFMYCLFA